MRINVYSEELTDEVVFVEKHVKETGKTYYGARFFLKSAPELHHTKDDDDRSAITFWCGSKTDCIDFLESAGMKLVQLADAAIMKESA